MGFRFYNLRPIYRTYLSRVSSPKNLQPSFIIQPFHYGIPLVFSDNPNYNVSRRWHLGHSHGSHDNEHHLSKEGERIFRLGLYGDIGLATGKALTGYLSGSTAIIADAAHSISDVVLSGVALWSFKAAKAPKDQEHPYGHL